MASALLDDTDTQSDENEALDQPGILLQKGKQEGGGVTERKGRVRE